MVKHEFAGGLPEFVAADEAGANFLVDVHVYVATTVTFFFVGEAVSAGEGAEGFGEEADFVGEDGDFAGLGLGDLAGGLNEIAGV